MINLIVIAIILFGWYLIDRIKTNRANPNKFSVSAPMPFVCIISAILILIFAFYFLLDFTLLFVIAILFAGFEIWAAIYDIKQQKKLKEYEEKYGNKSLNAKQDNEIE